MFHLSHSPCTLYTPFILLSFISIYTLLVDVVVEVKKKRRLLSLKHTAIFAYLHFVKYLTYVMTCNFQNNFFPLRFLLYRAPCIFHAPLRQPFVRQKCSFPFVLVFYMHKCWNVYDM